MCANNRQNTQEQARHAEKQTQLTVTDSFRTMRVTKDPARKEPNLAPQPDLARTPAKRASAFASSSCKTCGGARRYVESMELPYKSGLKVYELREAPDSKERTQWSSF